MNDVIKAVFKVGGAVDGEVLELMEGCFGKSPQGSHFIRESVDGSCSLMHGCGSE